MSYAFVMLMGAALAYAKTDDSDWRVGYIIITVLSGIAGTVSAVNGL